MMWVRRYQTESDFVGSSHRLRASGSPNAVRTIIVPHPLKMPVLWEGKHPVYLLSDHVRIDRKSVV